MIKVGIIGLQPRQVADVKNRKYKDYDLEFFTGTLDRERVAAFVRRQDHVIIIEPSVPKRVLENIPLMRRTNVTGGVSSVIRILDVLRDKFEIRPTVEKPAPVAAAPAKKTALVRQSPPQVDNAQPAGVIGTTMEPNRIPKVPALLGVLVPKGYASQYQGHADIEVIFPNEKGEHRYDLLDAAVPGDVVRYGRPPGVSYPTWRTRMMTLRWQRANRKEQLIEVQFYEDYADVLIMHSKREGTELVPARIPNAEDLATQAALTAAVEGIPVDPENVRDLADIRTDLVAPAPVVEGPVEPALTAEPIQPAAPMDVSPETREFWIRAFLHYSVNPTPQGIRLAADAADNALAELRKRFP